MTDPLVDVARWVALDLHAGQRYPSHGQVPFDYHLSAVVGTLHRFGIDGPLLLAAGWLHDVLEDTGTSPLDLRGRLIYRCDDRADVGRVAEVDRLVELVQSLTDEPGSSRAEQKRRTYPKLAAGGEPTVTVKLADRIANVEASLLSYRTWPKYLCEYVSEWSDFLTHLGRFGPAEMWQHLDRLMDSAKEMVG